MAAYRCMCVFVFRIGSIKILDLIFHYLCRWHWYRLLAWRAWIEHLQCWFKTISPSIELVFIFSFQFISFQYFFFCLICYSLSINFVRFISNIFSGRLNLFKFDFPYTILCLPLDHNQNEIQHLFISIAESCFFLILVSFFSFVFALYNGTQHSLSWWRKMIKKEWMRREKNEWMHGSSHSFWSEISFHFIAYLR